MDESILDLCRKANHIFEVLDPDVIKDISRISNIKEEKFINTFILFQNIETNQMFIIRNDNKVLTGFTTGENILWHKLSKENTEKFLIHTKMKIEEQENYLKKINRLKL